MLEQIKEQIKPGTAYEDACRILGVEPLTRETYNYLPQKEGDYDWMEHRIKRVYDAANKIVKFKANYRDTDQKKCFPIHWFSGSGWSLSASYFVFGYAYVGSRLCTAGTPISNYIGEIMIEEYAVIHNAKEE